MLSSVTLSLITNGVLLIFLMIPKPNALMSKIQECCQARFNKCNRIGWERKNQKKTTKCWKYICFINAKKRVALIRGARTTWQACAINWPIQSQEFWHNSWGDDNDDNDDNNEDDNDNDTISGVTWHWLWPIMRSLVTCQLTTYFTLAIPIL